MSASCSKPKVPPAILVCCVLLHEHTCIPDTAGVPELRPCVETLSPLQSVDRSITLAATRRNRLKGMRRRCAKLLARMARRAEELAAGSGGQQGAGTWGGESGQRTPLPAARDRKGSLAASSPAAVAGTDAVGGSLPVLAAAAPVALSVEAAAVLSKLMRIRRTLEKLQACNNVAGQPLLQLCLV